MNTKQKRSYDWFSAMARISRTLPPEELLALTKWESENLDGHSVATSDWPGWLKYLSPPPWKQH